MLDRLKTMQASGRLDAAAVAFERIRTASPRHVHAWLGLGYCAMLKGDAKAALESFETAAKLCPDAAEDAAIDCSDGLSFVGALESARAVLATRTATLGQQLALGALEERHGDQAEAARCYQRASEIDPQADLPLRKMINLHRRCGAFSSALEMTDRLAALGEPHVGTAWHARGLIHKAANDRDAALIAFRKALQLKPESDQFVTDLSRELQLAGKDDEAHALLLARPPTFGLSLALAEFALSHRDHEAALRHLADAHRREPRRVEPLARSASVEVDRGNVGVAQAIADRIEALGPDHRVAAIRSRIAICKAAGDEPAALGFLEQLAEHVPFDTGIRVELARQYRITGDAAAARKTIQRALESDARSPAALSEAAELARASDDYETALGFRRRVLAMAPENDGYHVQLARLLIDMDRVDEGRQILTLAEARFGRSVEIWGERIRILREAGHTFEALAEARAAQAAYPAHFNRWSDLFHLELRLSPLEAVERCIDNAPAKNRGEDAAVHFARGQFARRAGRIDAAIALFDSALQLNPRHTGALNVLLELRLEQMNLAQAIACTDRLARLNAVQRRLRGTTTNASQSHYGQLLNEFLLDRRAIAEIAVAREKREITESIPALLSLVRKRPAHYPSVFGLLTTLHAAGLFRRPATKTIGTPPSRAIPTIIGQFWDKPQLSDELLDLSASWRDQNPDHRHYLFNDSTARSYLRQYFPPPVVTAYRRCDDPATQADLFRLAFLLREGGVWADMDDRCLSPLSVFVPADVEACFWQEHLQSIGNNFMAVVPGHPIIRRAFITAVNSINRGDRDKVWMLTGPGLLSRAFAIEMAGAGQNWQAWLNKVAVLDEYDLARSVSLHCRTAHKRVGQHWSDKAFSRLGPRLPATSRAAA